MTNYTKKCRNKGIIFTLISWLLCFGIAIVFIAITLSKPKGETNEISQKAMSLVTAIGVSLLPMIVLAIVAKDKIRPTVWMIDVIMANILFNSTVMYIIFAVWLVDEYVISALAKRYRAKYLINQEIDKRN